MQGNTLAEGVAAATATAFLLVTAAAASAAAAGMLQRCCMAMAEVDDGVETILTFEKLASNWACRQADLMRIENINERLLL